MNVHGLHQGVEKFYPHACFVMGDDLLTHASDDNKTESTGLHSIITLSMKYLEIMLRHGHIQRTFDRDRVVQDNDPYMEGLLDMIRKPFQVSKTQNIFMQKRHRVSKVFAGKEM